MTLMLFPDCVWVLLTQVLATLAIMLVSTMSVAISFGALLHLPCSHVFLHKRSRQQLYKRS